MAITIWVLSPICNCKIKSWCIRCCSRTECLCGFVIVCFSLSIIKHTVVGLLKMSVIYAICHVKDSTEELVLFYLSLGNLECCFLAYGIVQYGGWMLEKLAAFIFRADDLYIVCYTMFKASNSSMDICFILSQNCMYQGFKLQSHVTDRTLIFTSMTTSNSCALKMEPAGSSKTLVTTYQATRIRGVITQNTTVQSITK